MKTFVSLESKDARAIIAKFLCIPIENVIPQRFGFGITGMEAAEIARRIYGPVPDGPAMTNPEEDDGK